MSQLENKKKTLQNAMKNSSEENFKSPKVLAHNLGTVCKYIIKVNLFIKKFCSFQLMTKNMALTYTFLSLVFVY